MNFRVLKRFNACFRYIDNLLCLNNDQMMDDVMTEIYPPELSLTSDGAINRAPYIDLDLEIRDGKIHTKLYEKRDAFSFELVSTTQTCLPWSFFVSNNQIRKMLYVSN